MLAAKSNAALGDARAAKTNAIESIALARHLGDTQTAIQGALARQSIIRDEYDAPAGLAGAREIGSMATDVHDDATLALALADQSWAHRLLGSERDALNAARDSERIAETTDNINLLCYALEQKIFAAITWWRFEEAMETAARCAQVTLDAGRLAASALQCAASCMYLALEDRGNASSAIAAAIALFDEDDREPGRIPLSEIFSPMRLRMSLVATTARLALYEGNVHSALSAANDLEKIPSPRARQLAELFRIDALFASGSAVMPFDASAFRGSAVVFLQDVFSGSRAPTTAQALLAASMGSTDSRERVFEALERIEAASRRTPLEADHAFEQIARAAQRCGAHSVAVRAELRARDYGNARALAISRVKSSDRLLSKNA
jgi:hypothetical protein